MTIEEVYEKIKDQYGDSYTILWDKDDTEIIISKAPDFEISVYCDDLEDNYIGTSVYVEDDDFQDYLDEEDLSDYGTNEVEDTDDVISAVDEMFDLVDNFYNEY